MQISENDNMRGNSGFLRLAVIGCLLVCSVTGGPPRPRRMMRETFSSPIEESMPTSFNTTLDSGTLCSHNSKEVLRSSVMCEKKNGCREIETHGECCPKFLCECKLNGTIYDNGEKIVDPENPCEVCVCRGGEINCNSLQCYSRIGCKNVTFTPGVCCPEYSNCPPLENVELNPSNETTTTENSNDYGSSTISAEAPVSTTTAQTSTQSNDSPGIKIKEITKPEEIRITDDRPKIFETIKYNEATATKTSSALHSQEIEPEHESTLAVIPDEGNSEIQPEIEPEIEQHTAFSFDGSADEPIQLESTDLNTVGHVSMGPKIVRQTGTDINPELETTISPFSSENEIKEEPSTTSFDQSTDGPMESTSVKHNTSVLQVGDSVVIFDRSGQTQSIPLRVAGLQRGEDTYDETVEHSTPESDGTSTDSIFEQSSTTEVYEVVYYEPNDMSTMSLDFPSDGASGDESGELKDGGSGESQVIGGSTLGDIDIDITSGYSSIDITDPMLGHSTVDVRTVSYDRDGSSTTSDEISTNFDNFGSSTSSSPFSSSEPTAIDVDDDLQQDQNINFPHITDDLSIHGSRMEDRMEDEDKGRVNGKIVASELEKIKIEHLEQNIIMTNEEVKNRRDDASSTAAPSGDDSSNFKDVEGRSPGEPLLIPEWERNQTSAAPFDLVSSSSTDATEDHSSAEMSSHENRSIYTAVVGDESTTNEPMLSSSTDSIDTNPSTSESGYEVESVETQSTSGPSQFRETNNFNLFLDGTADFFRIQKKIWNSAVL